MINNISNVDTQIQRMSVAKSMTSHISVATPPILSFSAGFIKEKAILRVKKIKRGDNIAVVGVIDDDYVDIVEEEREVNNSGYSFFKAEPVKFKVKYLKNAYIIDYIQSPKAGCGLGTEALKGLAEKAMFDPKAEGRILTYCTPVWQESSPARFFYKLGFRFMDPEANKYVSECIAQNKPDTPPQKGMMYLPKSNLNKLLRYGDLF